ncbi:hypothetical protein [Wenzhouxiangella limi]|uniref:Uncharacterized protein n=1 Tax=Wenzhouxiangella limi TaxID=2707351 RepID=A0A845UXV0_9GAMM|nr:hypothetical protein [Wenzhouxiangella limi]NDY95334.1 hypothetical protein [Wenzhouxiangella limi]
MLHAQIDHINPLQPVPSGPGVRKKKRKKVPARDERAPKRRDKGDRDEPRPPPDDDEAPIIDEYA